MMRIRIDKLTIAIDKNNNLDNYDTTEDDDGEEKDLVKIGLNTAGDLKQTATSTISRPGFLSPFPVTSIIIVIIVMIIIITDFLSCL